MAVGATYVDGETGNLEYVNEGPDPEVEGLQNIIDDFESRIAALEAA